jgi:hypothetical protein
LLVDAYLRRQHVLQQQQAVLVINTYAEAVNGGKRAAGGELRAAGQNSGQQPAAHSSQPIPNHMPARTPRKAAIATAEEVAALIAASNGSK